MATRGELDDCRHVKYDGQSKSYTHCPARKQLEAGRILLAGLISTQLPRSDVNCSLASCISASWNR